MTDDLKRALEIAEALEVAEKSDTWQGPDREKNLRAMAVFLRTFDATVCARLVRRIMRYEDVSRVLRDIPIVQDALTYEGVKEEPDGR